MQVIPSIELIRSTFIYDPVSGDLRWRHNGRNQWARAGNLAGQSTKNCNGYSSVRVGGRSHRVHRVIWAYYYGVWPDQDIDHINRDRADNRIENLRDATRSQNLGNSIARSTSLKGAHFDKRRGKWKARITVDYKEIWLGSYNTEAEAHAAYCDAARIYFGEFARAA
jgi:hypothetical protein